MSDSIRTREQRYLEYLKIAYPESALSIQSAQDFIEAMVKIQTSPGPTIDEVGTVSEGIEQLAKEQDA